MKKHVYSGSIKLLLAAVWLIAIILPLIAMLRQMSLADLQKLFTNRTTVKAIYQSLISASLSTVISVCLGGALAFCTARIGVRAKAFFAIVFTLPMLIPSMSHGMGLIILLGKNGFLTSLLHLNFDIYGLTGIIVGSVMCSFPVAYLMFADILKYEDSNPFEAAQVLGFSAWDKLTAIVLPYLRKPLISVVFAVFTMVVTDYGVPLMIGGKYKTLPVVMYEDVVGLLNFGKGSAIGVLLLLPAVISFLFDLFNKDRASVNYTSRPFGKNTSRPMHFIGNALCTLTALCVATPLLAFVLTAFAAKYPTNLSASFSHMLRAMEMGAGTYLGNSVIIAFGVALIGTLFAFTTAYLTARSPGTFSRWLHLLSLASLAVPGMVLGLSYALFFSGSAFYGTFFILIMANTVHFFASPYLMMYNTLGKININLEAVGQTLGIGKAYLIKDVLIPQTKSTLFEMFSYFFVNAMMTISAVSFLSNVRIKPVSLMINQFEAQAMLESAAFVSLLILGVNLIMKAVAYGLKKIAAN
jgi:ABC-type Fe3+ transport system, permease component